MRKFLQDLEDDGKRRDKWMLRGGLIASIAVGLGVSMIVGYFQAVVSGQGLTRGVILVSLASGLLSWGLTFLLSKWLDGRYSHERHATAIELRDLNDRARLRAIFPSRERERPVPALALGARIGGAELRTAI